MKLLEDYIELNVGCFKNGTITKEEAINKWIGFMDCLYYQSEYQYKIHFDETETIKKYIKRKVSEVCDN